MTYRMEGSTMMDEIMRQEERILLNQIAKLTEEGHC